MVNRPNRPGNRPQRRDGDRNRQPQQQGDGIESEIVSQINQLDSFKSYNIRTLVEQAQSFGPYLKNQRLETNQIRKFLDAINRLKAKLIQGDEEAAGFADIETDIVLLKPKLAYAAARQNAAKPLSTTMSAAIDKVHDVQDFERLVQFIESIIAYHKAAGGK
ncbi:MAG: type III-A CRISPR-associated protein Csm2 [Cyanobacteria bacterium P01_G01_bin.4]